jgi:hypothetical protein
MNYWVISPNVLNDNTEPEWKRIIQERNEVFIGYPSDESHGVSFRNEIKIGDLVLIAQGANRRKRLFSCGIVDSEAIWDTNPENPGPAQSRRLINAVKIEALNSLNLDFDGCAYGDADRIPSLYRLKPNENENDQRVVAALMASIRNQRKLELMENIRLSSARIEEINNLWQKFKSSYSEKDKGMIHKEIERIQNDWTQYRNKINDNTLTIDDYTNRSGAASATMPKDYLCNFLERDTKSIYGSSKPGNANNFEVKLNVDGETYTYRPELQKGDKENKNSRERAVQLFDDNIKSLLHNIIETENPLEKIQIIENSSYAAKQMLRKIAAMENKGDFLFMYSDDAIDSLHKEFLDSDETTNLGKSYEVRQAANMILGIDSKDDVESNLLSTFLWKYATVKGIADVDSPNVILYGPPGTGKTFTVMNSLEFLCQGDRSRYEFVQFHPSFTYEDFIEGIKPKGVSQDGNIKFELVDGVFKRFCKIARKECVLADQEKREPKPYYFVVDEINRANLSSVFGETLLCLEKGYRHDGLNTKNLFKTQYSSLVEEMIKTEGADPSLAYHYDNGNAYFGVPKNLFFIGMMNDVDKSIDAFDLALRRRFKWIRKDCDLEVVREETKFRNGNEFSNIDAYVSAVEKLNDYISETLGLGKSYEFGHSFFMKMTDISSRTEITQKNLVQLFDLHLRPTLKEYLRSLYPEKELDKVLSEALEEFKAPVNIK